MTDWRDRTWLRESVEFVVDGELCVIPAGEIDPEKAAWPPIANTGLVSHGVPPAKIKYKEWYFWKPRLPSVPVHCSECGAVK